MKTRWGCRRSRRSQGKVDWPAASHVLIKRLTARTMLMFRNDLVSTWGPTFSRSIFPPFPKVQRRNSKRSLFPSPASTFLSFITLGHAKVMFLRTINFHRNSPKPSTLREERITPIFRRRKKMERGKSFHLSSSTLREIPRWNNIPFSSGEGISRSSSRHFQPYLPTMTRAMTRFDEITRSPQKSRLFNNPGPECLRASTSRVLIHREQDNWATA